MAIPRSGFVLAPVRAAFIRQTTALAVSSAKPHAWDVDVV
jgi:hypothetical protein